MVGEQLNNREISPIMTCTTPTAPVRGSHVTAGTDETRRLVVASARVELKA
jgi:hypothetical protein